MFVRVDSTAGVRAQSRPIRIIRLEALSCHVDASFIRSQLSLPRRMMCWRLRLNGPALLFHDQRTLILRKSLAANGVSAARGRRRARALQHTRYWLQMLIVLHDWLRAISPRHVDGYLHNDASGVLNRTCAGSIRLR